MPTNDHDAQQESGVMRRCPKSQSQPRTPPTLKEYQDRFMSRVRYVGECWEWMDDNPNPTFWFKDRSYKADRAAWLVFKGPIESRRSLWKTCGNEWCKNPDHMTVGIRRTPTNRDRYKTPEDLQIATELAQGEKTKRDTGANKKETEYVPRYIEPAKQWPCRICGKKSHNRIYCPMHLSQISAVGSVTDGKKESMA